MTRVVAWFVVACWMFGSIAFAQTQWQKQMDAATQAYWDAHNQGRFEEAAAKREEARNLVARMPADAPEFGNAVRSVSQLYQSAGMTAKARGMLQEALSRSARSNPLQIIFWDELAGLWEQDQNLLQTLAYREQTAAGLESGPATVPAAAGAPQIMVRTGWFRRSGGSPDLSSAYERIADLNRRLGRPEARAAALAKVRALAKDDLSIIAGLYREQGQIDEAIRTYRQAMEKVTANPQAQAWEVARPFQELANLYEGEQRFPEAAATLRQAIEAVSASSQPNAKDAANSVRENLANVLSRAGERDAADEIHQQLLAESATSPNRSQILMNYASYLNITGRAARSVELLKNYLATHADLPQPWEETNLHQALATAARAAGDLKGAEEYQRLAAEKQPPVVPQITIAKDLQSANAAAQSQKAGDAVDLAMKAIDAASHAIDREQIAWQIPNLASQLALKSPEKAEQLYQHLFMVVENWASDTVQPQLQALHSYARFLMQQKFRYEEVPAAIERYKNAIVVSQGADSGAMEEVLRLTIESEGTRATPIRAIPAVRDLLAFEESLSGTTSEPYLRAVETAAVSHESAGDQERALALRRQSVRIADLALQPGDARRGVTRLNAAFALANHGQIDEAETLANEAAAVFEHLRPPQSKQFGGQLEQIRKMIEQRRSGARP